LDGARGWAKTGVDLTSELNNEDEKLRNWNEKKAEREKDEEILPMSRTDEYLPM